MTHYDTPVSCPDCSELSRRQFIKASTLAAASATLPLNGYSAETPTSFRSPRPW